MLLAPFLGGCTQPWSEGVMLIGLGCMVASRPPRSFGSRALVGVLLGLLGLSLTAFLPATWFGLPVWRVELAHRFGLPSTLSPQPWVSLDAIILLACGCLWMAWLQAQSWHADEHRRIFKWFAAGMALFAGVTLAVYFRQFRIPFWLATERMFGPFPNRNQTANFFALGSVLTFSLLCEAARAKKLTAIFWSLALGILCTALVVNYSRGGILVFFIGISLWIALLSTLSVSIKRASIGASILLFMLAGFLFFGGATLERFQTEGSFLGFRGLIFKDTFQLIRASPWCGVGLGNFESLFALFRAASATEARVLHPESDWLWLWSEMGWPAVVLAMAALALLVKQCFPLSHGTDRRLRVAALAAAVASALHGLVDVPAHRLGSVLPALFILGLALPPKKTGLENRMAPPVFRGLGLLMAAVGVAWVWASVERVALPGSIAAACEKQKAKSRLETQAFAPAVQSATAALRWKLLDWELYFVRGEALAYSGDLSGAAADFRRARTLETSSASTPWDEGRIWLSSQPRLALLAWQESLKRSQTEEAVQRYQRILGLIPKQPALLSQAHRLASGNARLEAVWLEAVQPGEFEQGLNTLLKLDPQLRSLPAGEQALLFERWATQGNRAELILRLEQNPVWQRNGWKAVANAFAAQNDFQAACQLARRFIVPPVLPGIVHEANSRTLQRRILLSPNDFAAGYALYGAQIKEGQEKDALDTLEQMTAAPKCPAYFYYLLAELRAGRGEWERSWKAFSRFGGK